MVESSSLAKFIDYLQRCMLILMRGRMSSSTQSIPHLKRIPAARGNFTTTEDCSKLPPLSNTHVVQLVRSRCLKARPNKGHLALAALNIPSVASRVIPSATSAPLHVTQNLDELAVRALKTLPKSAAEGHNGLVQVHGSLFRTRCLSCKHEMQNYDLYLRSWFKNLNRDEVVDIPVGELPRCGGDEWVGSNRYGRCGGLLRPDVVWFGEVPPRMGEIAREITACDLLIVVGTSSTVSTVFRRCVNKSHPYITGQVQPAAGFASQIQGHGGKVAVFNLDRSNNDDKADFLFLGSCDATLPEVLDVESDIAAFL